MQGGFDITKAGLKVGLEIHQQLGRNGDHKLFCHCPAELVEREPDVVVERRLRASAGETGATDVAAAAEQAKGKTYQYHAFNDSTCLVELDEEPPQPVNEEVIKTAVMIAKACGSMILPDVQFMRKTIVDGSATSGFQRTGLFSLGGVVPETDVRVQTICVEEDAAKIVSRTVTVDTYNLSRLGIPLLEIATEPDITTPKQAYEVAAQIGMLLRSSGRVKRGIGTIRQDINISIAGGTRVELKGSQDLRMIPTIVEYEARRQHSLNEVKSEIARRNLDLEKLDQKAIIDVTPIFSNSPLGFIKGALAKGDCAFGIRIPGFAGIFKYELCPNYRIGSEIADLARSQGFGGLIHSDEDMKKYGVDSVALQEAFSLRDRDAFIVLIGTKQKIADVMKDLFLRIKRLSEGVQKEVRKVNPDGTTSFLRPMPGASRMYPETDIPLSVIHSQGIAPPKLLTEQAEDLAKLGISRDQAKELVREGILFEKYVLRYSGLDPVFLATALLTYGKEIQARYKKELDHVPMLDPLFAAVQDKKIPRSAVFEILVEIAEGKITLDSLDFSKYTQLDDDALTVIIKHILHDHSHLSPNAIMGKVMQQARGKADGKRVMQLIEEFKRK